MPTGVEVTTPVEQRLPVRNPTAAPGKRANSMSQSTISSNGHNSTAPRAEPIPAERRQTRVNEAVTPEELIERHVENARRQLAEARESLKAGRRRVVQLEDALANWERFAAEVRRQLPPERR